MKFDPSFPVFPKGPGDYRFAWAFSFVLAIAFAPFVVVFKERAPWLIAVPLGIGAAVILLYEWVAAQKSEIIQGDCLVTMQTGFGGLRSYEEMLALEIKPRRKESIGQLTLFPGFSETTPSNAIKSIVDDAGRKIEVVNCDRYSALLVTYLLEHLDDATEKSLAAGLHRFGKLKKGQNDIYAFVQDKGIRETIKSDFRGNLLSLVSKGGEKVVRDLMKAVESRKSEAEKSQAIR
jgi:hypothetical protein